MDKQIKVIKLKKENLKNITLNDYIRVNTRRERRDDRLKTKDRKVKKIASCINEAKEIARQTIYDGEWSDYDKGELVVLEIAKILLEEI